MANVPVGCVRVPAAIVTDPVVVAFVSCIVKPPPVPSKRRLPKSEPPARMVLPAAVAVNFWVLEAEAMKVPPELSKFPPMERTFEGRVGVPAWMVKLFVVVAEAVVNVHAPVPLKVRL